MFDLDTLLEAGPWQEHLNRLGEVFKKIGDGGCIGILPKGEPEAGESRMIMLTVRGGRVTIDSPPFRGFRECGADLLFVADPHSLAKIHGELARDPLAELKRQIRFGGVVFFVLKARDDLIEMGFEDLIEAVGIPWIGTCH